METIKKFFKKMIIDVIDYIISIKERFTGFGTLKKDLKKTLNPQSENFFMFVDNKTGYRIIKSKPAKLSEKSAKKEFAKLAVDGEVQVIDREKANELTKNVYLSPCKDLFVSYTISDKEGALSQIVQPIDTFWTIEEAEKEFAKLSVDGKVSILNRQEADELRKESGEDLSSIMDSYDDKENEPREVDEKFVRLSKYHNLGFIQSKENVPSEKDEKILTLSENIEKSLQKKEESVPREKDKILLLFSENLEKEKENKSFFKLGSVLMINRNWLRKQKEFFQSIKG